MRWWLAFLLLLPVTVYSARGSYATLDNGPASPTTVVQGTVATVDQAFGRFTLASDAGTLDFSVNSNTPVLYHFARVGVRGLQPGDSVRVIYNVRPSYLISVEKL